MEICISKAELLKALEKLEVAEGNGFTHSLAVIKIYTGGETISDFLGRYDSLILKAHPTDPKLNCGRDSYPEWYKFVDGKIVEVED